MDLQKQLAQAEDALEKQRKMKRELRAEPRQALRAVSAVIGRENRSQIRAGNIWLAETLSAGENAGVEGHGRAECSFQTLMSLKMLDQ